MNQSLHEASLYAAGEQIRPQHIGCIYLLGLLHQMV